MRSCLCWLYSPVQKKQKEKCCKGWLGTGIAVSCSCLLLKLWTGHQWPFQALQESSLQWQRRPTFLLTESCCSSNRFWSLLNYLCAVQVKCNPSEQRRCFYAGPWGTQMWSWCGGHPAHHLGRRTSQMVSASGVPENNNSKSQGCSDSQRNREVRAHSGK